jgi:hypothetical protein
MFIHFETRTSSFERHCLDKDEQVEELVIHATLKPAQKEFRHGYA